LEICSNFYWYKKLHPNEIPCSKILLKTKKKLKLNEIFVDEKLNSYENLVKRISNLSSENLKLINEYTNNMNTSLNCDEKETLFKILLNFSNSCKTIKTKRKQKKQGFETLIIENSVDMIKIEKEKEKEKENEKKKIFF